MKGHYSLPLMTIMGEWYPGQFDLTVLKYVDDRTRNSVYGYFREESYRLDQILPNEIVDICLVYFFVA